MHPKIKNVNFTPTGKTAEELGRIRAKRQSIPETIYGWEAKRSGAAITITGRSVTGHDTSVSGIRRIARADAPDAGTGVHPVIAEHKDGRRFLLA